MFDLGVCEILVATIGYRKGRIGSGHITVILRSY